MEDFILSKKKNKTPGIYLDNNGTYYLKYKNKTYRGFKTTDDAEIHKAALKLGTINTSSVLFSIILKDYLISEEARIYVEEITYGTFDKRRSAITTYIEPSLGTLKMSKLNSTTLRDFRLKIANEPLSSPHKNYILATLKQVLKFSMKFHGLKDDLSIFLEYFPTTKTEREKKKKRLKHIWNDEEFSKFLEKIDDDLFKNVFILFFYHGLRIGEVQALKWTNFDDKKMLLNIEASITKKTPQKGVVRKETKTPDSERVIYLGKKTTSNLVALKSQRAALHGFSDDWYIFGTRQPLSNRRIDGKRIKACNDANLDVITNHEMRHMFVTNAWSKVPTPALSRYIGHKNVAVTLDKYSHLSQQDEESMKKYFD